MKYPFDKSISFDIELKKWDKYGTKSAINMRRLVKSHPNSWSNGSESSIPPSNLDHVYASTNMSFRSFAMGGGGKADVDVRGWVNEGTAAAMDKWIADYSDHSLLYFEVHDS